MYQKILGPNQTNQDTEYAYVWVLPKSTMVGTSIFFRIYADLLQGKEPSQAQFEFQHSLTDLFGKKDFEVFHGSCPGFPTADINPALLTAWQKLSYYTLGWHTDNARVKTIAENMALNNKEFLDKCKIAFIFRNPLDHLVSYHRHQWHLKVDHHGTYKTGKTGSTISLEEFIFDEGALESFVKQFITYHIVRSKFPEMILMVPYEERVKDTEATLRRIINHLGIPFEETAFRKALELTSFASLQEYETNIGHSLNRNHSLDSERHVRNGIIGKWQEVMSPELVRRIESYMNQFGLSMRMFYLADELKEEFKFLEPAFTESNATGIISLEQQSRSMQMPKTEQLGDGPNSDKGMTSGREKIHRDPNGPKMPCIVCNTMFKSASVYTSKTLCQSIRSGENSEDDRFGYDFQYISPGYVSTDTIVFDWAEKFFAAGSTLTQEHLDASEHNTQILKYFTDRMMVQLRDPRAVILSAVHHFNGQYQRGEYKYLLYVTPSPLNAPGYFQLPLEQQLDWLIENLLPQQVAWIQGWVDFAAREQQKPNGFKVLFTTYDELLANELSYFERIRDFYDIPAERFKFTPSEKTAETHFRQGDPNEWKHVFTSRQIQRMHEIIPASLLTRFGWDLPDATASSSSSAYLPLTEGRQIRSAAKSEAAVSTNREYKSSKFDSSARNSM